MKKVMFSLIALFAMTANFATASENTGGTSFNFRASEDRKEATVTVKAEGARVHMSVKELSTGKTFFYKEFTNVRFAKEQLSFEHLPAGEYIFCMDAEGRRLSKHFVVGADRKLQTVSQTFASVDMPMMVKVYGRKMHYYANAESQEDVTIALKDATGQVVSRKVIPAGEKTHRSFDLAALKTGEYQISISRGSATYSDTLVVE